MIKSEKTIIETGNVRILTGSLLDCCKLPLLNSNQMETIGFFLVEFVFSVIGWFCLAVWYRDRKKIQKIKEEEYAGRYSGAGRVFVLNFIAGIGAVTMFGIMIVLLVKWIFSDKS